MIAKLCKENAMTHQNAYSLSSALVEEITRHRFEAVSELLRVLLNTLMQTERSRYLQTG